MSSGGRPPLYAVDTNVLMDWQARYYPTDVFASLTLKIDTLIHQNRFFAPELVKEELGAVGTTELTVWADARTNIWISTGDLLVAGQAVQNRFPGLRDPRAEFEEADAYVIALAQLRDAIVVTQETSAAEKRNPRRPMFIPDVCRELGLPCISLLGLMRREDWKL